MVWFTSNNSGGHLNPSSPGPQCEDHHLDLEHGLHHPYDDDTIDDQGDVFFDSNSTLNLNSLHSADEEFEEEGSLQEQEEPEPEPPRVDEAGPEPYLHVLRETLAGAGRWAFGIAAIEIYVYNPSTPRGALLSRADGGWWRDRVFELTPTLQKIEDEDHEDYVAPKDLVPGMGAPGVLWTECAGAADRVVWRDLQQLSSDPDQPPDERLKLLAEVFGLAAGVPFHSRPTGTRGIVIFYARRSVDIEKIGGKANRMFLKSSAEMLGSVVSWQKPREEAIAERKAELKAVLRRVRIKIKVLYRFGALSLDGPPKFGGDESENDAKKKGGGGQAGQAGNSDKKQNPSSKLKRKNSMTRRLLRKSSDTALLVSSQAKDRASTTLSKIRRGGGQIPPPPLSRSQCLFAFLGCLLSLLTLSAINEKIKNGSSGDRGIILGPLGALVTMHYGLTSAPASQPRNSVLGVLVATVVSKVISYTPTYILPLWVRIAVAPAAAIVSTLALGLAHPPAGAVAVIFAADSTSNDWESLGLLLFGYVEAIIFAIVFINVNQGKTFPMYWGLPDPRKWRMPKREDVDVWSERWFGWMIKRRKQATTEEAGERGVVEEGDVVAV